MAGYWQHSMSNNAVDAYQSGAMPLSKWTKQTIIDAVRAELGGARARELARLTKAELVDEVLSYDAWHHTSKYYNKTEFYRLDTSKAMDVDVDDVIAQREPRTKTVKKVHQGPKKARVRYTVWSGTRRHPKATNVVEIVEIPADGGMVKTSNGNKRQSSLTILEYL